MRITNLARARMLLLALFAGCISSAWGCSSTSSVHNDDAGAAGVAGEASNAVSWCAAYEIINCSCQQCHQNPPLNGAPIPLLTYADTQAPFPMPTSEEKVWQTMQSVIRLRFMPYTADKTVMPPVKPLTDEQQNTLLTWLAQGAKDEGGLDCPQTCAWPNTSP